MSLVHRFAPGVAVALALVNVSEAAAHIDLLEPEARAHGTAARGDTDVDANSNLKQGPCGQVVSGRTERIATYDAGETITLRVREENAHVSYIRVSIDLDGEDFPLRMDTPPGPETQEVAAAAEAALNAEGLLAVYREDNDTPGFIHEIEVTLPRASCERCTLQVLQYMYDDPAAPHYFQCADLVLAPPGTSADAGGAGGDDGPTPPSGTGSGDEAGAGSGNSGGDAMTNAPAAAADDDPLPQAGEPNPNVPAMSSEPLGAAARGDGGGCSLSHEGGASVPVAALLALFSICARRRAERARARHAAGN